MSTTLPIVSGRQLMAVAPVPDGSLLIVVEWVSDGFSLVPVPALDVTDWTAHRGQLFSSLAEAMGWFNARLGEAWHSTLYPRGY